MDRCIDEWMSGWMDEWVNGWMGRWIDDDGWMVGMVA